MRPLAVDTSYLVTYRLGANEPERITGRFVGRRPMILSSLDDGYAFDVGTKLIVLTEAAIVGEPKPTAIRVSDVA